MRLLQHGLVGLVLLGLCLASQPAQAGPKDQPLSSRYGPIQKRLYTLDHELSFGWSYMPIDSYYKGYGVSLSYTIHFDHLWALELFRLPTVLI